MENYWWSAILFRVFLPCVISIASFIRPTITSYIYTVMGCYMPFVSVPTSKTMAGSTGSYLKLLITVCLLMCLMVYSTWFVLFFFTERQYQFEPCSDLEKIIRTVGIIRFANLPVYESIIWCIPEPLMLLVCIFSYFGFKKLTKEVAVVTRRRGEKLKMQAREINRKKLLTILFTVGKWLTCLMLCLTATLKPSAFGAVYYVMFLTLLTNWACDRTLGRVFARILACLIPIIFLNITIMIFYQFQYFHDSELFSTYSIWGRLFHLVDLKTYQDCTDPRIFKFYPHSNATYAVPVCLFVLYQLIILISREILEAKDGILSFLWVFFRCCRRNAVAAKWRQTIRKVRDNLEDRKAMRITTLLMADRVKYFMIQIMQLLMTVTYVFANIVIMVWAISYVTWSSLILLFYANIVWLLPFRRQVMLSTSPFLVFFMVVLLLTAYAYSLDLTREELPTKIGIFDFSILVCNIDSQQKWLTLMTKSLMACVVFASMGQYFRERSLRKLAKTSRKSMFGMTPLMLAVKARLKTSFITRFQNLIFEFLGLWWIWIVTITMIGIEFWTDITLFKMVFVAFVIIFLITFQILPFNAWKKFLKIYWWVTVFYALANLLLLYMSQIDGTRDFLQKYLSRRWYEAFHFEIFENTTDRFAALAWPLFLQITILIQQNFFQEEFNRITSPVDPEELAEEEEELKKKNSAWTKLVLLFHKIRDVFFAFLEAYLLNLILLIGWYMCLYDMGAVFVPVVMLLICACLFGRKIANPVVHLVSICVQLLIILRMIYMHQYRYHREWDYTGEYIKNGETHNVTLNSADWFGFHQPSKDMYTADFWQLAWCFGYVFSVVMHRIVTIRMANYRFSRELPKPKHIVMFPDVTWKNCHDTTGNLLKFLANYGFYKFGCEITLVFASLVIAVRMDAIAIAISLWLLVLSTLNRKCMKAVWLVFEIFLALLVLLEYVNTLGWWPTFFNQSLTEFWNSKDLRVRLQQFCQISNLVYPPLKGKINLDFWLLLLACRQWFVFRKKAVDSLAGSNQNVCHLIEDPLVENPVPDFMTYTETVVDSYKQIVFTSGFYIALIAVFLAGTLRPTLFSFGNIIASFTFLWEGSDMFLRPANIILRRWNYLIAYNVIVLVVRSASQIFECILIYEANVEINCKISRLFTIGCVDSYGMMEDIPGISTESSCTVLKTALGLGWDCFSFFCLICQQRIFKSYHFIHIVNNAKAKTILADCGAILIEEQRREKKTAIDVERSALEANIKLKMQRLREIEEISKDGYYHFDRVDIPLMPDKVEEESDYESFDPMPLPEYFGLFYSSGMETVLEITALRKERKRNLRQKLAKKAPDPAKEKSLKSVKSIEGPQPQTSKVIIVFMFIWGAFESLIVSTTNLINGRTIKFRYILHEMHKDLKILQENTNFTQGMRLGKNKIWHPSQSFKDILTNFRKQSKSLHGAQFSIYEKLFRALWYLVMTYSEWLCYLVIILNQTLRCSFLSLPLVMMVFCWGALTIPNPTKTFWILSIAYVLIMVFIKNSFSIGLTPWKNITPFRDNLFFPPDILGLYNRLKIFNLALMLFFLFHRLVLQMLGQWKPSDTRKTFLIESGEYTLENGHLVPVTETGKQQRMILQNAEIHLGEYFPKTVLIGAFKYSESMKLFFQQLISPSSTQIPVDVYTPMFFCDFINLFLLMFFYGSFWGKKEKVGIVKIVNENSVPMTFLLIILSYFLHMIIDRWIYIKRNRFAKLVYHVFQVIIVHMLLFIFFPMFSERRTNETPVVQLFYVLKCLYFLFSAYQIRNGYPTLISLHCLWHSYSTFNSFCYKAYRAIPYVLELRSVLDWMASDSSLSLLNWFKLEDITYRLFSSKCSQQSEKNWPRPSGQPVSHLTKNFVGGSMYVLLILTIIFPFLLFSFSSTISKATYPKRITMELYIGRAQPAFMAVASTEKMLVLEKKQYKNLTSTFNNIEVSQDIFGSFYAEDVLVVKWSTHSLTIWDISPGSREELLEELRSNEDFIVRLEISYIHIGDGGKTSERSFGKSTIIPPLPALDRKRLIQMVETDTDTQTVVRLPLLFPKFLLIKKDSLPESLPLMEDPNKELQGFDQKDNKEMLPDPRRMRNLLVRLNANDSKWWQMREECSINDDNYLYYLKDLVLNDCDEIVLYVFNEKVLPGTFLKMVQYGILGLYIIYFMVIVEIIKSLITKIDDIWLLNLPDVDKVLRKCMEVYVVRDMKNYELESALFDELIYIMRSRETLIKLTRYEDSDYDPTFITPGSSMN